MLHDKEKILLDAIEGILEIRKSRIDETDFLAFTDREIKTKRAVDFLERAFSDYQAERKISELRIPVDNLDRDRTIRKLRAALREALDLAEDADPHGCYCYMWKSDDPCNICKMRALLDEEGANQRPEPGDPDPSAPHKNREIVNAVDSSEESRAYETLENSSSRGEDMPSM